MSWTHSDGVVRLDPSAAGPWSPTQAHGGAVAAVLGELFTDLCPGLVPRRVTIDLLGPVPVGELAVELRPARTGRRYQVVEAVLTASRPVVTARAVFAPAGPAATGLGTLPAPTSCLRRHDSTPWPGFNNEGLELRHLPEPDGAAAALWVRCRTTKGLATALAAADLAAGLGNTGDGQVLNVDSTVHLTRLPEDWVAVIAKPNTSCAEAELHDQHGLFGLVRQTVLEI